MSELSLPDDVASVLREFFTCELTTINAHDQPICWPTLPYFDAASGEILVTASIAFPTKANNARRNPQVALLYSDPTGSGLADPPTVLVQGLATVTEVLDQTPRLLEQFRTSVRRQPQSRSFIAVPGVRRLFDFYFKRLLIAVTPVRILAWPSGKPGESRTAYLREVATSVE